MSETSNGGAALEAPPETRRIGVVGVKTRFGARPVHHTYGALRLRVGMKVMVKTRDGDTEFGEISENPRVMDSRYFPDPLPEVLRIATEDDDKTVARNEANEKSAYDFCRMKISELKLPMRLIEVRYIHSNKKATFYFSSDGRVDFRKLVRVLAERLSVRVEMRQIGVRDEAGMKGGCGDCGRTYCCSSFLKSFDPISVRMAKDQNLSLNPVKLSGGCGRLKCCLRFEHSHYVSVKKKLPACKKKVGGCDCGATVVRQDLLKEEVTLALETGDFMTVRAEDLMRLPTGQFSLKTGVQNDTSLNVLPKENDPKR